MKKEECIEFIKDWAHRIWELQEVEHLDRFYTPDVQGYTNGEEVTFDILKQRVGFFHSHLKKVRIEVKRVAVEKNKFAIHADQIYELKEGKTVEVPSMIFAHLKDGKIHKYWLKTRIPLDFRSSETLGDSLKKP